MKKILFVANVAKEHINKFHIPTIKYFKSKGWQVSVAASGEDEVPECDRRFFGKWKRSPFSVGTVTGIFQMRKILKENNYDVLYCHTPVGGFVARASVIGLKNKPKVVYFAHGLHFYRGGPKIIWLIFYPVEKNLSHVTDLMFTINKEDYALAQRKFSKKAKVLLYPGIGIDFERLKVENAKEEREKYRKEFGITDKKVLIYVAELLSNKNQGMLIEVLKKLSEKSNDYALVLVGPDHSGGFFEKLAKEKDVSDKVIFTGWRSDVGKLLNMADVCVASSIREGFGINLAEAMYAHLPVVAVKNRGHEMVIEDGETGLLVPLNDVEQMAECVEEIFKDNALRYRLSDVNVDKFNAETIAENLYREITDILS